MYSHLVLARTEDTDAKSITKTLPHVNHNKTLNVYFLTNQFNPLNISTM